MINWMPIVNRLRSSRGSLSKVAKQVNSCPAHLQRLARGELNDTKFSIGIKLLDMHSDDYPGHHRELRL